MKRPVDPPIPRRRAIRLLGGGAACLATGGLTLLGGCGETAGPTAVRLPLAELPEGVRTRVALGREPVEVLRTAEGVTARSLTCTHTGCEVAWIEANATYLCPCHFTRYDATGKVLMGPARLPLESVPARIEGTYVVIGEPAVG